MVQMVLDNVKISMWAWSMVYHETCFCMCVFTKSISLFLKAWKRLSPVLPNKLFLKKFFKEYKAWHMAGSSQPQHFFAAGCLFADFAIAVNFYSVIKTLWKLLCPLFGFCHTQILNLRAKFNFANMLEIIRKSGKFRFWPNFWTIFNIFAKLISALKFKIWWLQNPNNMQKKSSSFY